MSIVLSSGHGLKIRGASGYLDEVDEARKVVDAVADLLSKHSIDVQSFHDDSSTTQNENLETIVDFNNSQARDLDVSVHFNAYTETSKPMGTEVLYL
jgi:N-acetylmuramoyl-L-alanine amidase